MSATLKWVSRLRRWLAARIYPGVIDQIKYQRQRIEELEKALNWSESQRRHQINLRRRGPSA